MKYVDEFRNAKGVSRLVTAINRATHHPWNIMEVCGGQTHAIVKYGLDRLLPPSMALIHGPGCPVCVTPIEFIDDAIHLAQLPDVILCSFGDMLRVPGSQGDLYSAKARGGNVKIIYSPLDGVALAQAHPSKQIVCFAVGFETTVPAQAMAVVQASRMGLPNFFLLVAHVLVPPAMEAILAAPGNRVQGFLAAGHVCTIMGFEVYETLARKYRVPIVVTGFEPIDILEGIYLVVQQLESARFEVQNQYSRSVRRAGNSTARALVEEVFEPEPRTWRGMGSLPASGLRLRAKYSSFDALKRFAGRVPAGHQHVAEDGECQSGLVLQGQLKPDGCQAFGNRCTPEHPLGAPMVSTEGACAAYFRYRNQVSTRR